MKFFEDITIGERTELGSHTFTADEIKAFALKYDPQPFHVDEAAAARSHFGRLCASGWHTSAICMRHVVRRQSARGRGDARSAAKGRRERPVAGRARRDAGIKPVYPGDTITFASEIKDKRDTSRPGYGLVVSYNTGTNQNGELVYSAQGAVFVERRADVELIFANVRMDPLKLVALDNDDLEIISAHLQDAIVNVADIIWRPAEQRVVIALNRFDWAARRTPSRNIGAGFAALRFERVNSFKSRNIDPAARAVMLNLLAVDFAEKMRRPAA